MARKDISDAAVVEACRSGRQTRWQAGSAIDLLHMSTLEHPKVCLAAMERSYGRGFIEVGSSIAYAWPTKEGLALL